MGELSQLCLTVTVHEVLTGTLAKVQCSFVDKFSDSEDVLSTNHSLLNLNEVNSMVGLQGTYSENDQM